MPLLNLRLTTLPRRVLVVLLVVQLFTSGLNLALPLQAVASAPASLEALLFDPGQQGVRLFANGLLQPAVKVLQKNATTQWVIVDFPDTEVGLNLPRDHELLAQLKLRFPQLEDLSLRYIMAPANVVRMTMVFRNAPMVNANLRQLADGVVLSVDGAVLSQSPLGMTPSDKPLPSVSPVVSQPVATQHMPGHDVHRSDTSSTIQKPLFSAPTQTASSQAPALLTPPVQNNRVDAESLREALAQANQRVQQLEAQVAKTISAQALTKNKADTAALKSAQNELKQARNQLETVQEQLAQQQRSVSLLQASNAQLQDTIATLEADAERLKASAGSPMEINRLKNALAEKSQQLAAQQKTQAALEKRLAQSQTDTDHVEALVQEKTQSLQQALAESRESNAALTDQVADLQREQAQLDARIQTLQDEKRHAEAQIETLTAQRQQTKSSSGDKLALQRQLDKAEAALKAQTETLMDTAQELAQLRLERDKLTQQLKSLKGGDAQLIAENTRLKDALEQLNNDLRQQKALQAKLTQKSDDAALQAAARANEAAIAKAVTETKAELQRDLDRLAQDKQALSEALKQAQSELTALQRKPTKPDAASEAAKMALTEQVQVLQAETKTLAARNTQAEQQLAQLQQSLTEAKGLNAKLTAQLNDKSTNTTAQTDKQLASLNQSLTTLQRDKQTLEATVASLKQQLASAPKVAANTLPTGPTPSPKGNDTQADRLYTEAQQLQKSGQGLDAIARFRDATKLAPNNMRYSLAYANSLMENNNMQDGVKVLETVLNTDPYNTEAYNLLGKAYLQLNRLSDAQQAFAMAVPVNVLNNYASTLKKLGRFNDAERIYMTALAISPNDSDLLFNLGNLYNASSQWPKARDTYQQAITLRPEFAPAHYNLGLVYSKLNDNAKAIQHLEQFLTLDPQASTAPAIRQYITKLRKPT